MTFEELWDCVKNKEVIIFVKFKKDNAEMGPLEPRYSRSGTNSMNNSKYISFENINTGITIGALEPSTRMITIYQTNIQDIIEKDKSILIKCKNVEYEITFK